MKRYIWTYLLLAACATQNDPDGGPKDRFAPKPIFEPTNASVNFNSPQIVITFDEYFTLNSPSQNVLISPPIDPAPTFTVKGYKLIIDFNAPLSENTTYNMFFANAIKDVNEGNDTAFSYVFSTGSFIDSSYIKAKIVDAFAGKPVANAWLFAYKSDDSLISFKRPDYIAKSNKNGIATLTYIPEGAYNVFALEDKNADLLYSYPDEMMGFANAKILSGSDTSITLLRAFMAKDTAIRMLGTKYIHPGMVEMYFNQDIDPSALNSKQEFLSEIPNDTLRILSDPNTISKGSKSFGYTLNDEVDTVRYYVPKEIKTAYVSLERLFGSNIKADQPMVIQMTRPIIEIKPEFFELKQDSIVIPIQDIQVDSIQSNKFSIYAELEPAQRYTLSVKRGAVLAYYDQRSDSTKLDFRTHANDYLGRIQVSIQKTGNGILQLMSRGKVIRSETGKTVVFKDLMPGTYQLRYIDDADGDGKWSTGDYFNRIQPEWVYYFPGDLELKSGWDIEESWIID